LQACVRRRIEAVGGRRRPTWMHACTRPPWEVVAARTTAGRRDDFFTQATGMHARGPVTDQWGRPVREAGQGSLTRALDRQGRRPHGQAPYNYGRVNRVNVMGRRLRPCHVQGERTLPTRRTPYPYWYCPAVTSPAKSQRVAPIRRQEGAPRSGAEAGWQAGGRAGSG
jgi:hypothetical protein